MTAFMMPLEMIVFDAKFALNESLYVSYIGIYVRGFRAEL